MDRHTEQGIICTGLTKRFGPARVIDDLTLRARPGEITALSGPSGCGKTTLLNLMAGLERPTSGSVTSPGRRFRSFIFQDYNLLESMSAKGNALLTARLLGRKVRRGEVDAVFARLGIDGLQRRLPHQLSGGQQQRVAVARVLLADTACVFADEPTAALDPESTRVVLQSLRDSADAGATVVLVSHQQDAVDVADRVIDMEHSESDRTGRSPAQAVL